MLDYDNDNDNDNDNEGLTRLQRDSTPNSLTAVNGLNSIRESLKNAVSNKLQLIENQPGRLPSTWYASTIPQAFRRRASSRSRA